MRTDNGPWLDVVRLTYLIFEIVHALPLLAVSVSNEKGPGGDLEPSRIGAHVEVETSQLKKGLANYHN